MDSEKRALLAIALSLVILFTYQYFFAPSPSKKKPAPSPAKPEQVTDMKQTLSKPAEPVKLESLKPQQLPQPDESGKDVCVTSSLYTALFSSPVASLKSFKLHRYMDRIEQPAIIRYFKKLFASGGTEAPPIKPQWKELLILSPDQSLPLRTAFLRTQAAVNLTESFQTTLDTITLDPQHPIRELVFTQVPGKTAAGIACEKKLTFHQNDYRIDLDVIFTNRSATSIDGNAIVEWSHALPIASTKQGGGFFGGQSSAAESPPQFSYYINGKVEKTEFKDIKEDKTLEGDILWTAFEEKYFMTAIIPQKEALHQVHVGRLSETIVAYQLLFPTLSLKPNEAKTYSFSLYLGPKEINTLEKQNAHLEKTMNFGWFDIIAKPLLLALIFFNRYIGNYGIAIILITIIIKILFWPLTHKSYQSMKDMQKLQPEMTKLKEKYKDKKEELNREIMALYRKYKVNPLGGCLPIVLQIPVFIALYRVLQDSIELRHADFISFWINDLAAADPTYISPLLMGASMFYQQKMTPSSADPAQAKMMLMMPIVFTFMFLNFPAGLVIYWLVNNVLSIAQQLYINKKSHEAGGSEWTQSKSMPKPSKKQSQ